MKTYEDYNLPCLTLTTFDSGNNRIRTQFDYGIRQRRGAQNLPKMGFNIVIKGRGELNRFTQFWADLNMGIDKFILKQAFGPYTSDKKEVRFTRGYTLQEKGGGLFVLSSEIEIVDPSQAASDCHLYPADDLHPDNVLYPDKCPTKP